MIKPIFLLSALTLITCTFSYAQSNNDIQEVEEAIDRLSSVMVKPDSLILSNIASDDLVYVHSSGTVRDKQGFIDEFTKGWTVISKATVTDQDIKITNNLAIVRHHLVAKTDKVGQPPYYDILIMMVWRKNNGQWKLLARQAAKTK